MAFSDFKNASMRLTFDNGLDEQGRLKRKVKAYQNVAEAATADGIFQAAQVLETFGTKPLMELEKISGSSIYQ
ncbi:DUF1659 domain-containing protein [Planococcus sp. CP5-4]|uniref:DUF1659 domain-containing protein n=2 Tax=Planococcus TaxID=1372 RepID=A0A0U2P8E3_9BACL|nr:MULTISPECIES: DUF1659 domain-containing protein [Planococcus]ALS74023.1 hypothetical protein AUC31_01585 [Planococcus rifietoensis]AUD13877.1 DUF1659 domain-containing protein [Planococcus sp. MB-3u-03]MBU9674350.1 DUF1659 domain-containing protein [Planococcus sp. CP5-4_YE]MBV0909062.1 DUF1659 domain-containing protein [Planococcus sp. CP5-4_UN]MBW6065042.1 DUF1659 domain-containing protein [Planococcus sp. CP5-4]